MADFIVAAVSWQFTVRPVLLRVIRPASDSTSRCFMIAGSDTGNGRASSLTVRLSFAPAGPPAPAGSDRQAPKTSVERIVSIVNHLVKCRRAESDAVNRRDTNSVPQYSRDETRRPPVDGGDADEDRGHAGELPCVE